MYTTIQIQGNSEKTKNNIPRKLCCLILFFLMLVSCSIAAYVVISCSEKYNIDHVTSANNQENETDEILDNNNDGKSTQSTEANEEENSTLSLLKSDNDSYNNVMIGYKWMKWDENATFPEHAIQVAKRKNGSTIYIGRILREGYVLPANVISSEGLAYGSYNQELVNTTNFEILVPDILMIYWKKSDHAHIPENAIPSEVRDDIQEILYICRRNFTSNKKLKAGQFAIGKVHASNKVCQLPYGTGEKEYSDYDILVGE